MIRAQTHAWCWLGMLLPLNAAPAAAQSDTAFTYQGHLELLGEPLDDSADFEFSLWDAKTDGDPIGDTDSVSDVDVVDGRFAVQLDFGAAAFDGDSRWLEIAVRSPAGQGSFTTLSPRQRVTPTPYAMQTRGLFVDEAGLVGVGTDEPTIPGFPFLPRLHVADGSIVIRDGNGVLSVDPDDPNNVLLGSGFTASTAGTLTLVANGAAAQRVYSSGEITLGPTHDAGFSAFDGDMRFYTGGSLLSRMYIGTEGRVGIGTDEPGTPISNAQLDIVGGHVSVQNDYGLLSVNSDASGIGAGLDTTTGDALDFYVGGSPRMRVARTGEWSLSATDSVAASIDSSSTIGTWLNLHNTGPGGRYWRMISTGTDNGEGPGRLLIGYGSAPGSNATVLDIGPGEVTVNGSLDVIGSKNFLIDHPLEPADEALVHNAVEGPGYYTQYQGTVVLGEDGAAWVELPDYFEALNEDVSYQLTCVGGYAPVYISDEIEDSTFRIAGGKPGLKVSWQVNASRRDPYAADHPYRDVVPKTDEQRGRYYYPAGYGMPPETGIGRHHPADEGPDPSEHDATGSR